MKNQIINITTNHLKVSKETLKFRWSKSVFTCQMWFFTIIFVFLMTLPLIMTFAINEYEKFASFLSEQGDLQQLRNSWLGSQHTISQPLSSSSSLSSSLSSSNHYSSTVHSKKSNFSCYVCTTIDDMACKYLNETLQSIHGKDFNNKINENNNQRELNSHLKKQYGMNWQQHQDQYQIIESKQNDNGPINSDDVDSISTDANGLLNNFQAKCLPEESYCLVVRMGVSQPSNVQEFKFFALIRRCAKICMEGCFIIGNGEQGEKTKLSFCTSCCTESNCNIGNNSQLLTVDVSTKTWVTLVTMSILLVLKL